MTKKKINGRGQSQSNTIQPVHPVVDEATRMQYRNRAGIITTTIFFKYQYLTERIYIPDDNAFFRHFLAESDFLKRFGEQLYYLFDRLYVLTLESVALGIGNFYLNFTINYNTIFRRLQRFIFYQFGRHIPQPFLNN